MKDKFDLSSTGHKVTRNMKEDRILVTFGSFSSIWTCTCTQLFYIQLQKKVHIILSIMKQGDNALGGVHTSISHAYMKKGCILIQVFPVLNAYSNSFVVCSCILHTYSGFRYFLFFRYFHSPFRYFR